jgi:hypothetical protein
MDAVNGSPRLELNFVDPYRPGLEKFVPASSNTYACGVERCDPGPKSLFVAGGKVTLQGLPVDSPTWVDLLDVVPSTTQATPPMSSPLHCPTSGTLIHKSFSSEAQSANISEAAIDVNGEFSEVQQQRAASTATHVDMTGIRDCFLTSQTYLISLRVRMMKVGYDGTATQCSAMNAKCLVVLLDTMTDSLAGDLVSQPVYQGPSNGAFHYGEWIDVQGTLSFTSQQIDVMNDYIGLRIVSGEEGASLELESFQLQEKKEDACSMATADCRDLVPCNGDAGYKSSSPFLGTGGGQPSIRFDETKKSNYWHFEDGGMMWEIPTNCMVVDAVYKLEMKLRSFPAVENGHPPSQLTVVVYLKRGSIYEKIGVCSESKGEWAECIGFVKIRSAFVEVTSDAHSILIERITGGTYDIEDLRYELAVATFLALSKNCIEHFLPSSVT